MFQRAASARPSAPGAIDSVKTSSVLVGKTPPGINTSEEDKVDKLSYAWVGRDPHPRNGVAGVTNQAWTGEPGNYHGPPGASKTVGSLGSGAARGGDLDGTGLLTDGSGGGLYPPEGYVGESMLFDEATWLPPVMDYSTNADKMSRYSTVPVDGNYGEDSLGASRTRV